MSHYPIQQGSAGQLFYFLRSDQVNNYLCRICGLAFIGKVAFQPLTPMFAMLDLRPGQRAYMEQMARAFEALKRGITRLGEDYAASPLGVRPAGFTPHPLTDSSRQVQNGASMHSMPGCVCAAHWHSPGVAMAFTWAPLADGQMSCVCSTLTTCYSSPAMPVTERPGLSST